MAELNTISKASKFNQVYPLQKLNYSRDVTEASTESFVLVNMTSSLGTNIESRLLTELWRQLAVKFGDIKFCEIRADLCVEHYPERNTPTVLIYKDGDIVKQLVTLKELRGQYTALEGEGVPSVTRDRLLIWGPRFPEGSHRSWRCERERLSCASSNIL